MAKRLNIEIDNDGNKQKLTLKVYSPGDGAMSVNCVYPDAPSGKPAPFEVSEQDVQKFRDTHFRDYGILKPEGGGQFRLFKPVDRESEDRLLMEGKTYRYTYDADKTYERVALYAQGREGQEVRVENTVLEDAVDFYLKNEGKIIEARSQMGNEEAFRLSISGQAKQDRVAGFNI